MIKFDKTIKTIILELWKWTNGMQQTEKRLLRKTSWTLVKTVGSGISAWSTSPFTHHNHEHSLHMPRPQTHTHNLPCSTALQFSQGGAGCEDLQPPCWRGLKGSGTKCEKNSSSGALETIPILVAIGEDWHVASLGLRWWLWSVTAGRTLKCLHSDLGTRQSWASLRHSPGWEGMCRHTHMTWPLYFSVLTPDKWESMSAQRLEGKCS